MAASTTMTEKQKMLAGELYMSSDPELVEGRRSCRVLLSKWNVNPTLAYDDPAAYKALLKELLGSVDDAEPPFIEPPFRCDYGKNIYIGAGCYMNFGCTILDCADVRIGARVLFAPQVQLYAATHPLEAHVRQGLRGPENAKPITIGDDCWIGGSAVILPGVTIGPGCVVGAGAVVTRDVPPNSVVAGNPARVIRTLKPGERAAPSALAQGASPELPN